MISPEDIAAARQALGGRLAALRQAEGHNQHALAGILFTSRSSVANIERGRQAGTRDFWERCDTLLHADGALVGGYDELRKLEAHQRREAAGAAASTGVAGPSPLQVAPGDRCGANSALDAVRDGLRAALISYRPVRHAATAGRSVRELWAATASIHAVYQRGDYGSAASRLPVVLDDAHRLADTTTGRHRERALRVVAAGYLAASKLASKTGDGALAWLAADRAGTAANLAGALSLGAVSTYQTACALLRLPGTATQAETLAVAAADDLGQPAREPDADLLSARGALLLLAAVTAGRRGDHADVRGYLDAATATARQLGRDGNRMWTAFGPSNVAIHQLSIAVAMRQPDEAVKIGQQLDLSRLPAGLGGRRAQVHVELAAAHAQQRDGDAVAVLHLLEAERVAAQAVHVNIGARDLLTVLLHRERRSATPGLRPLAQRAGVAT
ncbi:helix-turn-helix domain-containing protein [Phytohabitans rumicis]|uniref:Transcriptional regulator n=1 Tax=Phytohabitans rumicis TaxID=1076125 RepID=A0A6V8LGL7_9ACTN|nr:helix-turn-helix transcriptional regulator [Phytohabitans rumicis]GFJ93256.1 transcriptional regulator [Phytohabitans rumicis]